MGARKSGFTLIEIMVVVGILISVMVAVGGILTSSFKAKNDSQTQDLILEQSQKIMSELKKNVFDANVNTFVCPSEIGSSIFFKTINDGKTTLLCDVTTNKIASKSGDVDIFNLVNDGVSVQNCNNFVSCQTVAGKVTSVDFNLDIGVTSGAGNKFWTFVSKVAVR